MKLPSTRQAIGSLLCLWAAASSLAPRSASAGGGPENYFLVVNSASSSSLTIANHYVELRKIPPSNVLYLEWRGDLHTTDINTFRNQILGPALRAIDARELTTHIDGIVYSSDFPYNIDISAEFSDQDRKTAIPQNPPYATLNALTFYYQMVLAKQPIYGDFRIGSNLYYRPVVKGEQIAATHGFRGWYGWGKGGQRLEAGGNRYLMSTIVGLTTGKGNSVGEVIGYLRRSQRADGTAPEGTIYFSNGAPGGAPEPRVEARKPLFDAAIAELKALGVKAQTFDAIIPERKDDIAGAMLGNARFDWSSGRNVILPGAIVENFTSYGAEIPNTQNHTLLTELLAAGAAGSSGTVVEPYALIQKFPNPFIHVHYARGCTLAEAFYQSVATPYQLVIVGDALCQPWAKIPKVEALGVAAGDTLEGVVTIRPTASGGAKEVDRFELYMDGARVGMCAKGEQLTLDTTQESDGFHELRVVGIESGPIETQGRVILPVMFNNHNRTIRLSASATQASARERIKVSAEAPGAAEILIYANGRAWRVNGEKGVVTVDTDSLGTGPVVFRGMGQGAKGKTSHVLAAPVTVQIESAR
jgi:hypothetical protein